MENEDLVSIIIPTLNRSELIQETITSVLNQTHINWECIIVDDGSEQIHIDGVKNYSKIDSRLIFIERPKELNKGSSACRNFGYSISKGNYIMWLDDDDKIDSNKIYYQYLRLKEQKFSIATCAWGRFSNENNYYQKQYTIFKNYNNPKMLLVDYGSGEFFPSFCFMVTRDLFEGKLFWNEQLSINDDAEFFCRVLLEAKKLFFVKNTFGMYRVANSKNVSSLKNSRQASDLIKSWKLIFSHMKSAEIKAKDYVRVAKKHSYLQLKEKGYKKEILYNFYFFKKDLSLEIRKKFKLVFDV